MPTFSHLYGFIFRLQKRTELTKVADKYLSQRTHAPHTYTYKHTRPYLLIRESRSGESDSLPKYLSVQNSQNSNRLSPSRVVAGVFLHQGIRCLPLEIHKPPHCTVTGSCLSVGL